MVLEAQEHEILWGAIAWVLVEMSDLPSLSLHIAVQAKTNRAAPAALRQDSSLGLGGTEARGIADSTDASLRRFELTRYNRPSNDLGFSGEALVMVNTTRKLGAPRC